MLNIAKLYAKDIARWLYWGPTRFLVVIIPKSVSYRLFRAIGICVCILRIRETKKIRYWMERVTGEKVSIRQLGDVFVQYYSNSLDTLLYRSLSQKNIDEYVTYKGLEHLNSALEKGKGVILLHPHFGNEEYLMPAMGHKGFTVSQVASRWEPDYTIGKLFALSNHIRKYAWRMRIGTREKLPVDFIYIDEGLRNIYRLLRNNEVLLLALDGREGESWQDVPFLGMTAKISPGPIKIAKTTDASILPTVIVRTGLYQHTVHIGEPIKLSESSENSENNIRIDTIAALQAIEPFIRKYPSQYAKFLLLGVQVFQEEQLNP